MRFDQIGNRQEQTRSKLWRPKTDGEQVFYADVPMGREIVEQGGRKSLLREDRTVEANSGDILTRGYASTWILDRDNEYVHPRAFDKSLPSYLAANPLLLWQHNADHPLGRALDAATDQHGLDMLGMVPRPEDREPDWKHLAYHSIAKGVVRTMSIGGFMKRDLDESDRMRIFEVELMETSIVSIPANPDSIFEAAVKAVGDGGSRRPRITQAHVDQMMQILGAAPLTNPELRLMSESQLHERYGELAAYYRRAGVIAPEFEEWNELTKEVHSAKGLAGVRGGATKTIAFMRKVQGHIADGDGKRGRTISQKNEEKLARAAGLLDEVLASVRDDTEE